MFTVEVKQQSNNNKARVKLLILSTDEMKYFWYLPKKKANFVFIFFCEGNFFYCFPIHFSIILLSFARLVGIILGVNIVCI